MRIDSFLVMQAEIGQRKKGNVTLVEPVGDGCQMQMVPDHVIDRMIGMFHLIHPIHPIHPLHQQTKATVA
jgi:hypothetical protein